MPFTYNERMTWGEFTNFCETTPSGKKWKKSDENTSEKSTGFSQKNTGVTWKETIKLASFGWPEGMEEVTSFNDSIASHSSERDLPVIENSIVGFLPNVPNYLSNLPDAMMTIEETPKQTPVIKLVIAPYANAGTSKEHFIWYGIAVMSLVETIEAQGVNVEIDMTYFFKSLNKSDGKHDLSLTIELKSATQPLDVDRMVFAIVHPAMFRRMIFHYIEQDEFYESHKDGKGQSMDKTPKNTPDTFHVPSVEKMQRKCHDMESYKKEVKSLWDAYKGECA